MWQTQSGFAPCGFNHQDGFTRNWTRRRSGPGWVRLAAGPRLGSLRCHSRDHHALCRRRPAGHMQSTLQSMAAMATHRRGRTHRHTPPVQREVQRYVAEPRLVTGASPMHETRRGGEGAATGGAVGGHKGDGAITTWTSCIRCLPYTSRGLQTAWQGRHVRALYK